MPDAVIYPPQIKKDKDKLSACYSLVRQMIDEHNRQSAIAISDKAKYASKFRAYTKEQFKPRLKQLLAERNRLIEKIRWDNYTEREWHNVSKLPQEEIDAICETLFGNKEAGKIKPILATSPILDELKTISLDSLSPTGFADPTEDFTSANWNNGTPQADEGSDLTVIASKVTWTNVRTRYDQTYFYRDCGANHFSGDFEHRVTIYMTSQGTWQAAHFWTLSNTPNADIKAMKDASASYFTAQTYSNTYYLYLKEVDSGTEYFDSYDGANSTPYYITFERDEAVGTHGTLYEYIYSDATRETLVDTLSISLHTSKKDFRYIYIFNSYDDNFSSDGYATGYAENLDLQEAVTFIPRVVGII